MIHLQAMKKIRHEAEEQLIFQIALLYLSAIVAAVVLGSSARIHDLTATQRLAGRHGKRGDAPAVQASAVWTGFGKEQ